MGIARKSSDILRKQKRNITDKIRVLDRMKDLAYETRDCLINNDLSKFGYLLCNLTGLKHMRPSFLLLKVLQV